MDHESSGQKTRRDSGISTLSSYNSASSLNHSTAGSSTGVGGGGTGVCYSSTHNGGYRVPSVASSDHSRCSSAHDTDLESYLMDSPLELPGLQEPGDLLPPSSSTTSASNKVCYIS